ncbi:MAG TPA: hypothetical protein ENG40_04410 [Thermoprotei archaeon]|nr:hypothetical protein [Thermoprotei archaeon]
METKNPNSNIICDEEVYEANVYVFKKPVSPKLVPTLMDVGDRCHPFCHPLCYLTPYILTISAISDIAYTICVFYAT